METAPVRPRRPPLKPITRELWSLAAPIIGLNVLNVLSLAVDTALCGRLPNQDVVLAALGYSVQLLFLLQVAMFGLTIGSVAMVARAHGARDRARALRRARCRTCYRAHPPRARGAL
jgi:Na+-driven multidrug efflux pump